MAKYDRQTRWGARHMVTASARIRLDEARAWDRARARLGLGCTNEALRRYITRCIAEAGTAEQPTEVRRPAPRCRAVAEGTSCPYGIFDEGHTQQAGRDAWCSTCPLQG